MEERNKGGDLTSQLKLNLSALHGRDEATALRKSASDRFDVAERGGDKAAGHRRCSVDAASGASTPRSQAFTPLSTARSFGGRTPRPAPLPTTRAAAGDDMPVTVVVHVRPMVERERAAGCQGCLEVDTEGKVSPEVAVRGYQARAFPFDQVYGDGAQPSGALFGDCVAPLVEGLFEGYNGTVLAYGQTGAGKTYTMGTHAAVDGDRSWEAVIPQVTSLLFSKAGELQADGRSTAVVAVSFFEVYQNSLRDLLAAKGKESAIEIRERGGTDITVEGHTEVAVEGAADVEAALQQGIAARATHATNMNEHSSRSHAIFTISLSLRRWRRLEVGGGSGGSGNDSEGESTADSGPEVSEVEEHLSAKMHLVDLAGSERIKKSGVQGLQQKEAASINLGLLALRNCIEALCERGRTHIPYRSNKLTRLLQDSLGGNARTVMVACVSPADSNMDETLSTLKYASSARNIKNKVVANRDEESSAMLAMMDEIRMLRAQLAAAREGGDSGGGGGDPLLLRRHLRDAAAQQQLNALQEDRDRWRLRATVAESKKAELHAELLSLKLEAAHDSKPARAGGGEEGCRNPLFTRAEGEESPATRPLAGLSLTPPMAKTPRRRTAIGAESPLPSGSRWPAIALAGGMHTSRSSGALQGCEGGRLDSAAALEAWHPLAPGDEAMLSSINNKLPSGAWKHTDDEPNAVSDVAGDLSWLPALKQARMEHEQAVLARKTAAAASLRARLEALSGSVLCGGDARLAPPGNKQEVDRWVSDAVCLDSQMADLEQILDARMASRVACVHELHAIERHIEVLREQLPEAPGAHDDSSDDDGGSFIGDADESMGSASGGQAASSAGDDHRAQVAKLTVRAAQLRESMAAHNHTVVELQSLRFKLQERFVEQNDAKVARKRFSWVDPSDFALVMTAVYNLTRKQRSQILALRADKEALAEEVAWRDAVLELLTKEVDEARRNAEQQREEMHRAASEKVRVLDAYGELQLENAELEERLASLEGGMQQLQAAYADTVRELTEHRGLTGRVLDTLAELRAASSDYAWESSKVVHAVAAPTPPPASVCAVQADFETPQGTSLISDEMLEALERAAVEKTKLATKLGEKEQLLFFLEQKLPQARRRPGIQPVLSLTRVPLISPYLQVGHLCAQWSNQQSPEKAVKSRKFSWWWGESRRQSEDAAAAPAAPPLAPAAAASSFFGFRSMTATPPPPRPEQPAAASPAVEEAAAQTAALLEQLHAEADKQEEAISGLNAAAARLEEAKAEADRALRLHVRAPREPGSPEASLAVDTSGSSGSASPPPLAQEGHADASLESANRTAATASPGGAGSRPPRGAQPQWATNPLSDTGAGLEGGGLPQGGRAGLEVEPPRTRVNSRSSAKEKAALFERLARKKEARSGAVRAAPPMAGRIDMQQAHDQLHHSDPVERVLPITPTIFDDRLPPQGQMGYVVQSVDFLESISHAGPGEDSSQLGGSRCGSSDGTRALVARRAHSRTGSTCSSASIGGGPPPAAEVSIPSSRPPVDAAAAAEGERQEKAPPPCLVEDAIAPEHETDEG
eukprot:jgi/Tetstr1/427841/TSEL_001811.t2